jgi:NAD(P)-dependent dehydrogenase (short-subunit alcohol dehydrogenase family)
MPKVFLITGSSRGLGRALAEVVLAAGYRLVATARRPERLGDLVANYGNQIRTVALDVTDPAAARAAVRSAVTGFGRLDVLVNNAGYANTAAFEDMPADDFREQVEANFFGVINLTRAALPVLRAQGGGNIINISSVGGRVTTPGLTAYQSAKWALGGFSEGLAQEVGPLGIKVTAIEPGGMTTDWAGSSMTIHPVSEPYQRTVGAMIAMLRTSEQIATSDPTRVAQAVLRVVEAEQPPVRLLLGSDAVAVASAVESARAASDAQWRRLSVSTDRDGAPPIDVTTIVKSA